MLRKACAVLGAAVLLVTICAGAAAAFTPQPGPIFNNPTGNQAARTRILHHIIASINAAPRFSTIRIAAYSFDRQDVADALINASHRGVNVQMVLNDNWTSPQENRLKRTLGQDPNRRSFVAICHGSCRGGGGNQHMKYYTFTRTGAARNVIMVGSANLTGYGAVNQWNDMYTVVNNYGMWNLYSTIFEQLARDTAVPHPYVVKKIGHLENRFSPHPHTTQRNDPVMQRLGAVHCRAGGGTGVNGRTVIRIVMYGWVDSRGVYLANKIVGLARAGCDVRVILSSGGQTVAHTLLRGGVGVRNADRRPTSSPNADNGESYALFTHEKWMILNGGFGSGSGRYVWTGSENWSNQSPHNDEVSLRAWSRSAYVKYLANFNYIWSHYTRSIGSYPYRLDSEERHTV
jgi:phosphatidylserine/phosphatidylglycerophosphate/cardiolipin synthase-like enzyme